jgi:aspartate/methionine/tyrosine aminotransferase
VRAKAHGSLCDDGRMGVRISDRIAAIGESATLAVDAKAKALKAAGHPVIGFGAGEPDFPTPDYIVAAAVDAARNPAFHHYTAVAGLPALRDAVAAKTRRDSGYAVDASQVLITNGGKQAIYNAFATLLDPGDEVLVAAPYWTTYPEAIQLAGGVQVDVATDETTGYLATVAQLEAARTPRTKVLLFVSPSNPTGAVYPPDRVAEIGRWAAERGLWVVTDEIYEHLVYGRRAARLDGNRGSGPRRPHRGRQRGGQDVRDDRLAGWLAHRPRRRRKGGDQFAVAHHLQRGQRVPGGGARRGPRRPVSSPGDA